MIVLSKSNEICSGYFNPTSIIVQKNDNDNDDDNDNSSNSNEN